jgi:hypothetical protein
VLTIDPGGFRCPCGGEAHGIHLSPREAPAGSEAADVAEEHVLFGLPFILVDPALRKEYLGVELDERTGELLEKLRILRQGASADEWIVASFDRSTRLLKRALWKRKDGLLLTLFSEWKEIAGIRVATRRDAWILKTLNDHFDLIRPDRTDRLEEIEVW